MLRFVGRAFVPAAGFQPAGAAGTRPGGLRCRLSARNGLIRLLAFVAVAGMAQTPVNPDVRLSLGTRGGQTAFHVGELIPLELTFTATVANRYQVLDAADRDRWGPWDPSEFSVKPETGWDDPIAPFFGAGILAGSSPLRFRVLSEQPVVLKDELNRWVRFQAPGVYRITVKSGAVSRVGSRSVAPEQTVISPEFTLTIVPATNEWRKRPYSTL